MANGSETIGGEKPDDLSKQLAELREQNYFLNIHNQELSADKEKYQLISDFVQDWDFWLDPKAKFVWISPSCYDLTGYSSEEFIQDPDLFYQIIYPDDENRFRQFFRDVQNFIQIGQSLEFRLLTRTKQMRWCELNCKSVFDRKGSYLGQRGSIRDITRLMTALGQIREMSDRQIWEEKAKQKYRNDLAGKDREMVSSLIMIAQKNELVQYLRKNLSAIRNTLPVPIQKKVAEMIVKIDEQLRRQSFNWDDFKLHFEKVNPGFFIRLHGKFPQLTTKDLRLCAYLRLGLSTKDIASLVNVTPESAEIGRVRLRKKLYLDRQVNLSTFLREV